MLAFVNAAGGTTPPIFFPPKKDYIPQLIKEGSDDFLGLVNESGWMTSDNFYASLGFFHGIITSSKANPILLIMDNHQSHIDYKVVKSAKDIGIVLLTFPPYCSHALKPLGVTVLGPLKAGLKHSHND
jgi:hypothetical protein